MYSITAASYLSITNILTIAILLNILYSIITKGVVTVRKIRAAEPADSNDTSGFKGQLKRATTEMLILLVLRHGPLYTYEIMNTLERMSGGYLAFNTLYIAIYRLKELQFIEESGKSVSDDNRMRVYFSITVAGIDYLDNLLDEYKQFSEVIDGIIRAEKIIKIS